MSITQGNYKLLFLPLSSSTNYSLENSNQHFLGRIGTKFRCLCSFLVGKYKHAIPFPDSNIDDIPSASAFIVDTEYPHETFIRQLLLLSMEPHLTQRRVLSAQRRVGITPASTYSNSIPQIRRRFRVLSHGKFYQAIILMAMTGESAKGLRNV